MAARRPQEAEEMASVLQVISAIENIGNDAVDIARIVTHRLGTFLYELAQSPLDDSFPFK